jgi:allantoinase
VTTLVDMPLNSNPTVVDAETFDLKLKASANKLHVDVAFWGGLVPDNARNQTKLKALIDAGVVGLKAFMSPSGIGDFENASVDDLKLAMRTLNAHHVPLMAHAELLTPVEEDPDADPRKYATYLATRPRVWEKVRKSDASDATTLLEPENARALDFSFSSSSTSRRRAESPSLRFPAIPPASLSGPANDALARAT